MGCTLDRRDYDELYPHMPHYPISTALANAELTVRGIASSLSKLEYLISKGAIPTPSASEGRNRLWTKHDVDCAYAHLDSEQVWTPGAAAFAYFNIDMAEFKRAERLAMDKYMESDCSKLTMTLVPGAPGISVPCEVSFRPLTDDEEARRLDRLKNSSGQPPTG